MKKYLPSTKILILLIFIGFLEWIWWGVKYPDTWLFAETVNSHPAYSGIAAIIYMIVIAFAAGLILYLISKYDDYIKS